MKKATLFHLFTLLLISSFVFADELSVYQAKAESGDAYSQLYLGLMYESGEGVTQDYEQAVYWYSKSAEQGDGNAQFNLALLYESGEDVTQGYKKAFYWYSKSAEQMRFHPFPCQTLCFRDLFLRHSLLNFVSILSCTHISGFSNAQVFAYKCNIEPFKRLNVILRDPSSVSIHLPKIVLCF